MHHRNHKNSTANYNNPQHHKPQYPSQPAPSSEKKSVLNRIRERFQEKPATKEEVQQLGLNAKRETYKTQIQRAKNARGSRLDRLTGGGGRQPSHRRTSHFIQQDSGLFGGGGGSWLESSNGPSFDFITGGSQKSKGRRNQDESFTGKGLSDLF